VKVCDFGLAREFGPVTEPNRGGGSKPSMDMTAKVGTLRWMASEVFKVSFLCFNILRYF